jgi:hypothetical protein
VLAKTASAAKSSAWRGYWLAHLRTRQVVMPFPRPLSVSAVFVVEDDEMLRMCATNVVADAGFTAVKAANADEAVAILDAART